MKWQWINWSIVQPEIFLMRKEMTPCDPFLCVFVERGWGGERGEWSCATGHTESELTEWNTAKKTHEKTGAGRPAPLIAPLRPSVESATIATTFIGPSRFNFEDSARCDSPRQSWLAVPPTALREWLIQSGGTGLIGDNNLSAANNRQQPRVGCQDLKAAVEAAHRTRRIRHLSRHWTCHR